MRCCLTSSVLALGLVAANANANPSPPHDKSGPRDWNVKNFKSIVTFGDSYTDENRLGYFINNKGQAPPVGWEQGIVRH